MRGSKKLDVELRKFAVDLPEAGGNLRQVGLDAFFIGAELWKFGANHFCSTSMIRATGLVRVVSTSK